MDQMTDRERIDRLEKASAEHTNWLKGNWVGPKAERSAAGQILHEQQALQVIAAGKNLFCEKPLTMTGEGAKRVVTACSRAGKVLGVGHERRFEAAFEEVQRLVSEGALGKMGIRAESIKSGPLKDMGSPFKSLGRNEREVMQEMVDEYFQRFIGIVRGRTERSSR